jgi:NAD+ synthase (glutamine-hydrolysing)
MAEPTHLRLALAQINPTVGDVEGNARLITDSIERARDEGAQLVVLPELCLSGYPSEDLLLRRDFLDAVGEALESLAADVTGIVALVGFPERVERPDELRRNPIIDPVPPPAYNSLAVLADGEVANVYRKIQLPNYGVFDERRYFEPGTEPEMIEVNGAPVGLTVCEDIWVPGTPESDEAAAGARLIVNASASPYARGKGAAREAMIAERARSTGAAMALCNTVGGQDELVFDGRSVVVSPAGETLARAAQFEPELLVCDVPVGVGDPPAEEAGQARLAEPLEPDAEVYTALTLGVRDYVEKNGFEGVVLGLSGGIDSALVAQVAADAVGAEALRCIVMPSPHSSGETQADARAIAHNLGAELIEIPIDEAVGAYEHALGPSFEGTEPGIAEENLQARIRGNLVMALSNKFGWLVLTTGNKSEMSVGYATLYGDMAGGFAVLKDVWKTLVYRLVRHRNERAGRELVPAAVLERAPSAELRPDQRDEDSLPPYDLLDRVLEGYVERDQGREELIAQGLDAGLVDDVITLVDRAEYKRRQAPPGIRISTKAFGRDRRLPITNRFTAMRPLPR